MTSRTLRAILQAHAIAHETVSLAFLVDGRRRFDPRSGVHCEEDLVQTLFWTPRPAFVSQQRTDHLGSLG